MWSPLAAEFDETSLRSRWATEGVPVWADGDVLTMVCESEAAHVVTWPVFQMPMDRVGENLFALRVEVQDLDRALISYAFWEIDESGMPVTARPPDPVGRFRGPNGRVEAPSNRDLRGTFDHHTIESVALGAPRNVAVYVPPNHSTADSLPVVYATDGGMSFVGYARRLDAAIEQGTMPPVIVVAAHSAGTSDGLNLRGMEYLPGFDENRFARHRRFFVEELAGWAETRFNVRSDRPGKAAFGCSDGAVHALTLAQEVPEAFGHVIAYSGGMPPDGSTRLDTVSTPMLHLGAGTLEGPFFHASEAWANYCHLAKINHSWTETVAGHDLIQWCENLPGALAAAFGRERRGPSPLR